MANAWWQLVSRGLMVVLAMAYAGVTLADSAQVLPKGISAVFASYFDYFDIKKRFDDNGDKEDIGVDFNGPLDSSVFTNLRLVDAGFGLPAGSASLGDSRVKIEYDIKILELEYYYGLTDKLTAGFKIPYWWVTTNVDAAVDSGSGSSATVGFNPSYGTAGDPFGSPIIPIELGGQPATDEDIQNILGPGVSINGASAVPGFGYDRFETWDGNGLADIELTTRYQYVNTEDWRHAFTAGLRVPTGRIDDPDNLTDFPFGTGAWALLLRSNHDITSWDRFTLNLTLKYDIYGSDKQTLRVVDDPDQPIADTKAKIDIDYANIFEFDATATYKLTSEWSIFSRYQFFHKDRNNLSGPPGFDLDSLRAETNRRGHQYHVGLSYSTISRYFEGRTNVPISLTLRYRDRFAGTNTLNSRYIMAEADIFF